MVPNDENPLSNTDFGNADLGNGVPSHPGFERLLHPSVDLSTLDLEQLPPLNTGITVLQRTQHLRVYVPTNGVALFDFDGTIRRTEDICHRPRGGCYEIGVRNRTSDMGLPYESSVWDLHGLSDCLSTGLERDCERLAQRLSTILNVEIDPRELIAAVKHSQITDGPRLLEQSPLIEQVDTVLWNNHSRGIKNAVVSASPQHFVELGVRISNLEECFIAIFGGRTKKIDEGRFSSEAVDYACHKLGVRPNQCIMIGDSISDVSTAMLAGVPNIIVLLEGDDRDCRIQKLLDGVHDTLSTHRGDDGDSRQLLSTIVVLEQFGQVDFYPSNVIDRPSSIILPRHMHKSIEVRSRDRLVGLENFDTGPSSLQN